ncbi:MAG: PKD domain-containing protein, partial [Armatimonadetes bacterium]|nr:PKD domain-containing protein [Armatimonadota bacterium]
AGEGKRAAGWAAVQAGDSIVTVLPRDFWQHWPKGIAIDPAAVRLDLLPDIRDVSYGTDFYNLKKPDHRLYYLFDQGSYKLKAGCSKRQEIWLTFGVEPEAAARAVNNPPFLAAEPAWYQQTSAFGEISIETQQAYPSYETSTAKALDEYLNSRERNQEYGVLNFGDWYGERGTNWGNIEYDTQHAFFMQFARSGDWRWLRAGEEAERHNQDVDTVWAGPNKGLVYAHCLGHVGDYLDARVGDQGSRHGGFTVSHTWCEGHAEYYYLTGDRRARDTAVMIADAYARKNEANYEFTNCRDSGWHLILQCAVYELTGDPYYLNMARTIVDRIEERQTADGGWERQLVPGHCTCDPPRHRGNAGFMVGVQLSGLKSYHLLTGEPRVIDILYKGSKFLIEDMWVPSVHGFRYTSCPKSSAGYWSNTMLFEGMAYVDRFKPDAAVQSILREGCEAQLSNIQAFGKSLSMNIRATPRILYDMERLDREEVTRGVPVAVAGPNQYLGPGAGDLARFDASGSHDRGKGRLVAYTWDFGDGQRGEGVKVTHRYEQPGQYRVVLTVKDDQGHTARSILTLTAAPLWLRQLDPKKVTQVEAESFAGQGGGEVQLFERVATSGKMVTKWHQEVGHWLEWKLVVPSAGRYQLAARY